jgi:hypothetical protein
MVQPKFSVIFFLAAVYYVSALPLPMDQPNTGTPQPSRPESPKKKNVLSGNPMSSAQAGQPAGFPGLAAPGSSNHGPSESMSRDLHQYYTHFFFQ